MSKLDDILFYGKCRGDGCNHDPKAGDHYLVDKSDATRLKDLLQKLIDETFDKDDTKAYELWQKIEQL